LDRCGDPPSETMPQSVEIIDIIPPPGHIGTIW
jgi:hypothetical protein